MTDMKEEKKIKVTLIGMEECKPCELAKEALKTLEELYGLEVEHIDITEILKEQTEETFEKIKGVPLIKIKSKCNEKTVVGFSSKEDLEESIKECVCPDEESESKA